MIFRLRTLSAAAIMLVTFFVLLSLWHSNRGRQYVEALPQVGKADPRQSNEGDDSVTTDSIEPRVGNHSPLLIRGEQLLPSHWGEQWSAVRKAIIESAGQETLDRMLSGEYPSWDQVDEEVYSNIVMDEVALLNEAQRSFPATIPDSKLSEILANNGKQDDSYNRSILQSIVMEHEPAITEGSIAWAHASRDYRKRIWNERLYRAAPGFLSETHGDRAEGEGGNGSVRGWVFHYYLDSDLDPAYSLARSRLSELCQQRDLALVRASKEL